MKQPLLSVGRLTGKAVALGIGRTATVGAQFAINLLLVRWWVPEEFGTFQELRVFVSIALLLELGLATGILHATAGKPAAERDRLLSVGTTLSYLLGVFGTLVFAVSAFFVTDASYARALLMAGVLVAANLPATVIESVLVVRDRHRGACVVSAVTAVIALGLTWAVLVYRPTIASVYAALAFAGALRLVAYQRMSGTRIVLRGVSIGSVVSLIRVSLGVSASRMLGIVSGWMDRVVVMAFFSSATLGIYAAGAWEVPFMAIFFGAITAAIVPDMSEHWQQGRRTDAFAIWTGSVARSAWIVFPLAVWAWLWSPELIRVLFTDTYAEAVPVFRAYLGMMPLRVAVYGALFVAIGDVRALVTGALIDVAVNVVTSVVLASVIGPVGPAIATVFATWVQIGYYLTYVARRYEITVRTLLPWKELAVAAAIAVLLITPTVFLRHIDLLPPLQLALGMCIVGAVMMGGIYFRTDTIRIGGRRRAG